MSSIVKLNLHDSADISIKPAKVLGADRLYPAQSQDLDRVQDRDMDLWGPGREVEAWDRQVKKRTRSVLRR